MKARILLFATILCMGAIAPVQGKESSDRPFFVNVPMLIEGASIPSGMYQVTVRPVKAGVEVTFRQDGRLVASARGTWNKSEIKSIDNAVLLQVNPDGTRTLLEMRFAGDTRSVVLNHTEAVASVAAAR